MNRIVCAMPALRPDHCCPLGASCWNLSAGHEDRNEPDVPPVCEQSRLDISRKLLIRSIERSNPDRERETPYVPPIHLAVINAKLDTETPPGQFPVAVNRQEVRLHRARPWARC